MARPRSTRAHEQVLDAALKLFAERGIDSTSMDAIAETSGVSKATIYKHWPDKAALCLEVMARLHGLEEELPVPETNDIRAEIVSVLSRRSPKQCSEMQIRLMPHLMAYAVRNPAFGVAWRARVMEPPRAEITRLLKRAVDCGQLSPDLDYDLAVALLVGPMMYRHVLSLINRNMPEDMPNRVVEAFWNAHAKSIPRRESQSPNSSAPLE